MKLIHLSDLHLGKRVHEYSMIEDQKYILQEILHVIDAERPDAVLIAGDVYDKSQPVVEAVELLDDFLTALSHRGLQVFLCSGNHDSAERLAFGGRLLDQTGIHISPVYGGKAACYTLSDAYGPVDIHLLPFVKPLHVRSALKNDGLASYTDALQAAVEAMNIDPSRRNVRGAHQFVTCAVRCDSEELSVGGVDNVAASVFDAFDYVALGHIHGPQNIGSERIRYCGSPLKYSFSEAGHQKSVTVAELGEKGELTVRTLPLTPRRDLVELKGTYEELTLKAFYENTTWQEDYTHITLTDEEDIPDAIGKLRAVYHRLMKLDYDNRRTRSDTQINGASDAESKSPLELFSDFYELQNHQPMGREQLEYMQRLIEKTWEDEQ